MHSQSRGFIFGSALAHRTHKGLALARKPNKLPLASHRESYGLEYGSDSLEIQQSTLPKGARVLIVDDVLATGGTAKAVCELVERLGGEIVQCNFLMELTFLNGRSKLGNNPVFAAMTY